MTQQPDHPTAFRPAGAIYTPGGWVALAATNRWLLLHLEPADPIVRNCWSAMARASVLEDVLEPLLAGGLRAMPDFAMAEWDGTRLRTVIRGTGMVRYTGADAGPVDLSTDAGTWWDVVVEDLAPITEVMLTVVGAEPSPVRLPLTAGVTMAGSIVVEPERLVAGTDEPSSILSVVPAKPAVIWDEPVAADDHQPASPPVSPDPGADPEPPGDFDHLFAATAARDAAAAVEPERPTQPADQPARPADQMGGPSPEPDAGDPGSVADPEPALRPNPAYHTRQWSTRPSRNADGLIDSVPWMQEPSEKPAAVQSTGPVRSAGQPAPTGPRAPTGGVQQTVKRSSLELPPVSTGPMVQATFCPSGHPNPAPAVRCRTCEQPIPAQDAKEIPRPVLGMLRLSTGEKVLLDRRVLIGREPPMPDVSELDRPHVLRLTSSLQVSRNHVEVKLDGWRVYVEDLGSTNGTFVTPPDQPTVRLDEHDPRLVEPGTEVRLSDDFSFIYQVRP